MQTHCGWHRDRQVLGVKTPHQANNQVMNMQQVMEARRLSARHSSRELRWCAMSVGWSRALQHLSTLEDKDNVTTGYALCPATKGEGRIQRHSYPVNEYLLLFVCLGGGGGGGMCTAWSAEPARAVCAHLAPCTAL